MYSSWGLILVQIAEGQREIHGHGSETSEDARHRDDDMHS
jgi:hypothetical protein